MRSACLRCLAFILLAAALLPVSAAAQAPDATTAWTAINQPAFDPQKVATVSNVKLQRDLAQITLASGLARPRPAHQRQSSLRRLSRPRRLQPGAHASDGTPAASLLREGSLEIEFTEPSSL
jgi:hypothetical protein